jgi:hypothetical protein
MKTWVLLSALMGLIWGSLPQEAAAAYTQQVVRQWVVEWGETVTRSVHCRRCDVDGLGGIRIGFIDGRATWVHMDGVTGARIRNRETLDNGYRATLTNYAVYEESPDIHFPVIFQISIRCRYEDPEPVEEDLEMLFDQDSDTETLEDHDAE